MNLTVAPILEASGVAKSYGAVAALKNASLSVQPGEVHALMGANGAGKSTFVKILTGAIPMDRGDIRIRGKAYSAGSPARARAAGLVSVYQEPALIPDLDVLDNLRLTRTPIEPFMHWVREMNPAGIDPGQIARYIPLAMQRILDLARALAIEPDVLLLDEMTAALPADLVERVIEVIRRQSASGRSVIFISHRFAEIAALCHRATVLRDGETVGVEEIGPGVEEKIVELMLGTRVERARADVSAGRAVVADADAPRIRIKNLQVASKLNDVSFDLRNGEIVGVVALEGQGQDELFATLSGAARPTAGVIEFDGRPVRMTHPADAVALGVAYVPGDRSEALLGQQSVRENIALPFSAPLGGWGPIRMGRERSVVQSAIERLQIDTRAQREVRRLSGGNQQKVTIARWVAADARTILCFDPTRGIDVRTKHEIYKLLRELAAQGKSVLFYTSELEEIQSVCDRVIVIFGGKVVDEVAAADADEPTLTRAAYGLGRGAAASERAP